MQSFLVRGGRLVPRAAAVPRLRPGWALVRVRLAGICNTDLEILRGYFAFRGTPGHEFVGEVADVRARERGDGRWVGRRVVGEINIGCASLGRPPCAFCRRGLVRHCVRRRVLGIVGQDGAFAEHLALPLANLHRVPDAVPDEQAVFTEPLAAACEILEQVPVARRQEAAVLGDGKLAQLIARVLRAAGLRVTMFGRHANKLARAQKAGIAVRCAPGGSVPALLRQRYPLVVEATGSPAGIVLAQQMAMPRGTVVLKSTFHGAARVETWPIVVNELTLVGSRCGPFPRALALLRGGQMDLGPLITRVFPLREAPAAMRYAARSGVLKVLLKP
jgi:threonine dehydrogenase-like Zn-dependent dehydrogenase